MLDIASMSLFLMALDCQYFGVPEAIRGFNQEFPAECKAEAPSLERPYCMYPLRQVWHCILLLPLHPPLLIR
jgi:hypothetical protein